jgi:hypothetical protein
VLVDKECLAPTVRVITGLDPAPYMEGRRLMPSSTSQVYHDLLNSTAVPATVQRRILHWGNSHSDPALLAHLAAIDELDPEVENSLAQTEHAEVLLAWANRPGRSTEALIERLMKEKRATLLVGLAQRSELSQEVYTKLADSRSITVRWALLANTSVDLQTRESIARTLAPEFTKDHQGARRQLTQTLGAERSLWAIFVNSIRSDIVVDAAFDAKVVDGDIQVKIVDYVIKRLNDGSLCYELSTAIGKIVRKPDLDPATATRLQNALESFVGRFQGSRFSSYEVTRASDSLKMLRTRPQEGLEDLLRAVANANDAEQLQTAVESYLVATAGSSLDKTLLAETIITHPQVTPELVSEYITTLRFTNWAEVASRFVDAGQWDHLAAIAEAMGMTNYLIEVGEHREVIERVLRRSFVNSNYDASSRSSYWLLNPHRPEIISKFEDLILAYVPAALVVSIPELGPRVLNDLVNTFGDDPRRWEMFETLIVEYDGTLPDLLETAVSLSC